MKKEYKIVLGDQVIHEGIPDKTTAENIFWGRVRHVGSCGEDVILYRDDKIIYRQVARCR
jgi:hypothetical protein